MAAVESLCSSLRGAILEERAQERVPVGKRLAGDCLGQAPLRKGLRTRRLPCIGNCCRRASPRSSPQQPHLRQGIP
eukprot:scaffold2174_cov115-Pinguiococcus_pyrenoidosus.AAC.1